MRSAHILTILPPQRHCFSHRFQIARPNRPRDARGNFDGGGVCASAGMSRMRPARPTGNRIYRRNRCQTLPHGNRRTRQSNWVPPASLRAPPHIDQTVPRMGEGATQTRASPCEWGKRHGRTFQRECCCALHAFSGARSENFNPLNPIESVWCSTARPRV